MQGGCTYLGCSFVDNGVLGHAVGEGLEAQRFEGDPGPFWCMLLHMSFQSLCR